MTAEQYFFKKIGTSICKVHYLQKCIELQFNYKYVFKKSTIKFRWVSILKIGFMHALYMIYN